jgi:hypothetical protein
MVVAAHAAGGSDIILTIPPPAQQNSLPENFPVITDTTPLHWPGVSDNCIAYRNNNGGVYLHKPSTGETFTIIEETDVISKMVVSQGIAVWRSERAGAHGLWGYYNPECSDTKIFGTEIIDPFYIVSRWNAHAPALSGEMLTFDTNSPKGWWFVALIELDANNNNIPDATEPGYLPWNPYIENVFIPISYPIWEGEHGQKLSDIYWDDDYKIACWYSDSGGVSRLECNDLSHWQEPNPWIYRFQPSPDARPFPTYQGLIAVHRDLVVWTDYRDLKLSGYDLYIADLDLDDDGILNPHDPDPGAGPSEFVLVNRPYHQEHPDIWWPYVVWTDQQNCEGGNIYAYDLSLDSDGDGTPNWRDLDRPYPDPAIFPVALHSGVQATPELWNSSVIWQDWRNGNGDIYGAMLETPVSIISTPMDQAINWLNQQTVYFPYVEDIPGYRAISPTPMITRYKSFTSSTGTAEIRRAWYPANPGSYVISFDFCNYGTDDQKKFLGRFGRGFTYDQALVLIVHTMLAEQTEAQKLGRYISSFQNEGQLTTTTPGSFGFSFNGRGYGSQKDNFYDLNYIRGGANGWLGYGYVFYSNRYNDIQFLDTMTGIGDYLLDLQVISPTDVLSYGLFTGGYGGWFRKEGEDRFFEEDMTWVSAEHNIDIYFFLRDLGQLTGDSRYIEAANRQKDNMHKLWNETLGRFDQGLNDPSDALDASSWGAMYWIAVGDLEKAKRSLDYADRTYSRTMTVSNTVTSSPKITIWGYKPYAGMVDEFDWTGVDLIWSEGSLGVAMANLKLGHALLDRCDPEGNVYIQKAKDIVAEMEKLQTLDPEGGLFYSAYPDYLNYPNGVITDFARAPSVAGTAWYLMVKKAMEDKSLRDAFWGPDPSRPSTTEDNLVFLPIILKGGCS